MNNTFIMITGLGCLYCGESFWLNDIDEEKCHNCGKRLSKKLKKQRIKINKNTGKLRNE